MCKKTKDLYKDREFIEKVAKFFEDNSHIDKECADLYFNGEISELNLAKSYLIENDYLLDYDSRRKTPKGLWAKKNNGIIINFEKKMKKQKNEKIKFWIPTICVILTLIVSIIAVIKK